MVKQPAEERDFYAGDLYAEFLLVQEESPRHNASKPPLFPGIFICVIASAAAGWFSDHYGTPLILMGLLIGLALNFVASQPSTHRGLDITAREGLRAGIILLGLQLTVMQIGEVGIIPFAALALVMTSAFAAVLFCARLTGQGTSVGLLAGGSTAICGASAALALYGVIGQQRLSQAQFTLTLVVISAASALAMTFYPILADMLKLSDRQSAFLIGASIHDVAQAIGAGYAVSDAAGIEATVVKLTRVALLAPLVALAAILLRFFEPKTESRRTNRLPIFPKFILAFLLLVALNSFVAIPDMVTSWALVISKALLLLAVTAAAMRTRTDLILSLGWRSVLPVLAATLASLVMALLLVFLVIE